RKVASLDEAVSMVIWIEELLDICDSGIEKMKEYMRNPNYEDVPEQRRSAYEEKLERWEDVRVRFWLSQTAYKCNHIPLSQERPFYDGTVIDVWFH
ncbi:MAG: hypothetical protein ISS23_04020, partial [Nanoarchaeota archaeon]|nr:hypothetical protein [Nanoarchaeota archaeon]